MFRFQIEVIGNNTKQILHALLPDLFLDTGLPKETKSTKEGIYFISDSFINYKMIDPIIQKPNEIDIIFNECGFDRELLKERWIICGFDITSTTDEINLITKLKLEESSKVLFIINYNEEMTNLTKQSEDQYKKITNQIESLYNNITHRIVKVNLNLVKIYRENQHSLDSDMKNILPKEEYDTKMEEIGYMSLVTEIDSLFGIESQYDNGFRFFEQCLFPINVSEYITNSLLIYLAYVKGFNNAYESYYKDIKNVQDKLIYVINEYNGLKKVFELHKYTDIVCFLIDNINSIIHLNSAIVYYELYYESCDYISETRKKCESLLLLHKIVLKKEWKLQPKLLLEYNDCYYKLIDCETILENITIDDLFNYDMNVVIALQTCYDIVSNMYTLCFRLVTRKKDSNHKYTKEYLRNIITYTKRINSRYALYFSSNNSYLSYVYSKLEGLLTQKQSENFIKLEKYLISLEDEL